MATPNAITTTQLARRIGTPDAPRILDVRIDDDHNADPRTVPGSVRRSHRTVSSWGAEFAGQSVVVICQRGQKLSQGSAAWLRYVPISHPEIYKDLPSRIVIDGDSVSDHMAGVELQRGLTSLLGRNFTLEENRPMHTVGDLWLPNNAIVVRSFEWAQHHITADRVGPPPGPESYYISWNEQPGRLFIAGEHPTGEIGRAHV